MVSQEQYFKHADGQYEAAVSNGNRGPRRSEKSLSFERLEKRAKFVLVEVMPKLIKFVVLVVPVLVRNLAQWVLPARRKSVKGQVALVTGGGNGLGKALCERFAQEGCSVAVADIDLPGAQNTARELQKRYGVKAEAFQVDVADYKSVVQLRKRIEASVLGPVDILVNNAGLLAMLSLSEGTPEDVQRILNVNLTSHFWTIREFKAGMVQRRRGHIIGVSSVLGYLPSGRTICYSATKFGVRGLMASLNEEIRLDGLEKEIHTTCVFPGGIRTRKQFVDFMSQMGMNIPWHTPRHVADVIVNGVLENKTEVIPSTFSIKLVTRCFDMLPKAIYQVGSDVMFGKLPVLTTRVQ